MPNITLHDYQEVVADFATNHPHCGLFLPMGAGKTMTTLEVLNRVMPSGNILVVAPLNIVRSTWLDEIEKWGFNVRTRSLITNPTGGQLSRERRLARYAEAVPGAPTMYFINQELIHDLVEYMENRFDARITRALYDFVASRVDEEVASKMRRAFGPRDDVDVPADLVSFLVSVREDVRPAEEKYFAAVDELAEMHDLLAVDHRDAPDAKTLRKAELAVPRTEKSLARRVRMAQGIDQALLDEIVDFPRTWGRANKVKMHPFVWPFQTVIVDESQGFKNPGSRRFRALKKVRSAIFRLIELSGTPTPQGLLDLWSQVFLLDQGLALGKTMTEYKNRWFFPTRYVDNRPVAWEPKDGAKEEIYERIKHLVMSVENTDLHMPDVTIDDVFVHLDPDEMKAYKEFADTAVLEVVGADGTEADITADNAAVLSAKLTQFASGTMYTDPAKYEYANIHSKKIEMTDYILRNTPSPTIVAYRFVSDKIRLEMELRALGHDVHVFDGSRQMVHDWNAGKIGVLLLQPASAGHGLNLQDGGHTLIWYTLPVSLEHYLQANARIARQGQTHPVMIHRLLTKGTYDTRLPGMLSKKKIELDDLIEAVKQEIGAVDDPWLHASGFSDDEDFGFDNYQLL